MDLVSFFGGLTISCLPVLFHHCVVGFYLEH